MSESTANNDLEPKLDSEPKRVEPAVSSTMVNADECSNQSSNSATSNLNIVIDESETNGNDHDQSIKENVAKNVSLIKEPE